MATNTSVQGSVTLRKLRSGSTVGVSIWTSQQLFQTYDAADYDKVGPVWSPENPVKCQVMVNGAAFVGAVEWQINGNPVASIAGINVTVDNGTLTIKSNLARALEFRNGTLKAVFKPDASSNTTMTKTADITIMQVTGSQYNVLLSADNGGVVDESTDCKITASVLMGTEKKNASGFDFTWTSADGKLGDTYGTEPKDTKLHNTKRNGTGKNVCTVTSADVDGMELFFCSIKEAGKTDVLDSSAIAITDNSDPYRLTATITDANATAGQDNQTLYDVPEAVSSVTVKFAVVKADGSEAPDSVKKSATWLIQKYHSDTMNLITGSSDKATSTGGSKAGDDTSKSTSDTITVYDCDYLSSEKLQGMAATTHNTNVIVQADCTLNA